VQCTRDSKSQACTPLRHGVIRWCAFFPFHAHNGGTLKRRSQTVSQAGEPRLQRRPLEDLENLHEKLMQPQGPLFTNLSPLQIRGFLQGETSLRVLFSVPLQTSKKDDTHDTAAVATQWQKCTALTKPKPENSWPWGLAAWYSSTMSRSRQTMPSS
jgi:hypothetical protein